MPVRLSRKARRSESDPHSLAEKETGQVETFSDGVFAIAITLLILGVTIVSFPTAFVAEYLGYEGERLAALVYAGNGIFISLGLWGLWMYTASPARKPQLLRLPPHSPEVAAINAQYRFGPLFYAAAFGISFLNATAGMEFCWALAAFFALPPRASCFSSRARRPGKRTSPRSPGLTNSSRLYSR